MYIYIYEVYTGVNKCWPSSPVRQEFYPPYINISSQDKLCLLMAHVFPLLQPADWGMTHRAHNVLSVILYNEYTGYKSLFDVWGEFKNEDMREYLTKNSKIFLFTGLNFRSSWMSILLSPAYIYMTLVKSVFFKTSW